MSDFFKRLVQHFLTACVSLVRHLAMTLSSISAVMVTLLLIALFLTLAGNIDHFTMKVEGSLKIHATIDTLKSEEEIAQLKSEISEMEGVKDVYFSSKEDELGSLIEESGSVFSRYEKNNPMSDAFIIEVKQAEDIQSVNQQLNEMDSISEAQYGGESVQKLIDMIEALRDGGVVFIVFLSLLAVFLISNTIKMTIYTRQDEIAIMRSVGASNSYVRTPFLFEGMMIGLLGAIVPILIIMIGYSSLYTALDGKFLSDMFILQSPFPYVIWIALLLAGGGILVGLMGSFLALAKFLRWRR